MSRNRTDVTLIFVDCASRPFPGYDFTQPFIQSTLLFYVHERTSGIKRRLAASALSIILGRGGYS